jgi:D-2-hydroxyacid dehydrogenase (NADP+)
VSPAPWYPRRILVGYNVHDDLAAYIRERRSDLEIRSKVFTDVDAQDMAWAEVFVGFRRPPVRDFGSVRWVHCIGAGVDAFLFRKPIPDDVLLTRSSEPFGPQIAEYCVSRALASTQHLFDLEVAQREHRWAPRHITTLGASRVLVVGTGEVGTAVANAFHALGCPVSGISLSGRAKPPFEAVHDRSALVEKAQRASWLVLALPLTEATFHIVDRAVLENCRDQYLINVGRGSLVDESVLPEALDCGWLRGAALDVFEEEPLVPESPLWDRPNVVLSPHIAGLTTTKGAGDGFLECLADLEAGRAPAFAVDRAKGY